MKKSIFGLIILLSITMAAKSQVKVNFEVSFTEPQAHYAEVQMDIAGIATKNYVDVKMPVWTPGSYLVREFAKSVEGFGATVGGKAVKAEKVSKAERSAAPKREEAPGAGDAADLQAFALFDRIRVVGKQVGPLRVPVCHDR